MVIIVVVVAVVVVLLISRSAIGLFGPVVVTIRGQS